jgi:hypothetical protein
MTDMNDWDTEAVYEPANPNIVTIEADDYEEEAYDKHLAAEILLSKGDSQAVGTVIG